MAPGERAERTREEQNGNDDGSSWRVEIVRQECVNAVGTTTTRTARTRKVAAVAGLRHNSVAGLVVPAARGAAQEVLWIAPSELCSTHMTGTS